jgi:hypothetical protein
VTARRRRPRAVCLVCTREYAVLRDRRLWPHPVRDVDGQPIPDTTCAGCRRPVAAHRIYRPQRLVHDIPTGSYL